MEGSCQTPWLKHLPTDDRRWWTENQNQGPPALVWTERGFNGNELVDVWSQWAVKHQPRYQSYFKLFRIPYAYLIFHLRVVQRSRGSWLFPWREVHGPVRRVGHPWQKKSNVWIGSGHHANFGSQPDWLPGLLEFILITTNWCWKNDASVLFLRCPFIFWIKVSTICYPLCESEHVCLHKFGILKLIKNTSS